MSVRLRFSTIRPSYIWRIGLIMGGVLVAVSVFFLFRELVIVRSDLGRAEMRAEDIKRSAYAVTYRVMSAPQAPWRVPEASPVLPAPDTASPFRPGGRWRMIGGPNASIGWPEDYKFIDIKAMDVYRDRLYIGIRSDKSYNPRNIADVFRYDGSRWEHVGGNGIRHSWKSGAKTRIQDLQDIGGYLYAAIGGGKPAGEAELWRFDGETWELFGGRGINGGWDREHGVVFSVESYKGDIYAGLHSYDLRTPPAIYRFDSNQKRWHKIAGNGELGSWPARDSNGRITYYQPYEMAVYKGELYVGMASITPRLDIWRFDGSRWEKIGGGGIRNSWRPTSNKLSHYLVTDLKPYQGHLIATLAYRTERPFHPIWAFDGQIWRPVGNRLPGQWRFNRNSNNAFSYRGYLYVGIQNPWIGASLWEYDGRSKWRPVLGYGKYGSWGPKSFPGGVVAFPYHGYVYRITEFRENLIVSTGGEVLDGGQVWSYSPPGK